MKTKVKYEISDNMDILKYYGIYYYWDAATWRKSVAVPKYLLN